jgi:hypothetical protein
MESAGQRFDAGGQIHRRSDASEFQAISTTDISERDFAQMKRQTEPHTGVQTAGKAGDGVTRLASGRQCGLTNLPRVVSVGRDQENREQPIAQVLENLAASIEDRLCAASWFDRVVKPRMSENQITAFMASTWPRLICPARIRAPA